MQNERKKKPKKEFQYEMVILLIVNIDYCQKYK